MSKGTPRAAVAKFAEAGKPAPKKDLGLIAMTYGNIYVACVAMGAKDEHTLRAFIEAEAYPGPSLIIAYSHCIAHGINMTTAMQDQKAAVLSGYWPLFRFDPQKGAHGESPLQLDAVDPKIRLRDFMYQQNRFKMLAKTDPIEAERLMNLLREDVQKRINDYKEIARAHVVAKEENS